MACFASVAGFQSKWKIGVCEYYFIYYALVFILSMY
jgi:hypothetical protein